jgi:hypothetical protein
MLEVSLAYWNKLADQLILISSLLSGFSLAITATFLVAKIEGKVASYILRCATVAAGCFLATIFSMTKVLMMTTEGFPMPFEEQDLMFPRIVAGISFILGIISLSAVISLAGWTKSRRTGIFTTVVGVTTLVILLMMLS